MDLLAWIFETEQRSAGVMVGLTVLGLGLVSLVGRPPRERRERRRCRHGRAK